jgi:hypothetical protein
MTLRRLAAAVLPAVCGVLAACAGAAPPTAPGAPGAPGRGDDYLVAGAFDDAVRAYERESAASPDSPVLREKLLTARTRAAAAHAAAAMRAADAGDVAAARSELSVAERQAPDLPVVKDAQRSVEARAATAAKADGLRAQARAALLSDPDAAARLLAEADGIAPSQDPAVAKVRREANLRAEAWRSAGRAEEAWTARDRARTVRELEAARFGGRAVARAEELRRRIERDLLSDAAQADEAALRDSMKFAQDAGLQDAVVTALRDRLVQKLVASAEDLRQTHRPAVAALLEAEAKRLRPGIPTPARDSLFESIATTVLVAPFDDTTGGRVDGARLARALRDRLVVDSLGGGMPLRVLDDTDETRAAAPDAVRLTGRVLSARQSEGRVGRETRKVPYQAGTTRSPNPEFDDLISQVDEASAEVRKRADEHRSAVEFLNALGASNYVRTPGSSRIGDVVYETRLAEAQAGADHAKFLLDAAKATEFDLRQKLSATPREIDVPVIAEHVLTVTTRAKTAQLTAHVTLVCGSETLLSEDVSAAAQHKETISDAFEPAGLLADPDDTPDDAVMAALAADRFAAMATGRVRAAAEGGARRHLVAARRAEAAGQRDAAAEAYALYLLSTADVPSPERADAARALRELLGVHVALATGERREDSK